MKMMKKILSIFVSAVIMFTSVLLTAFFTFADDTLNYNCKWDFSSRPFNIPHNSLGCYIYIDNYDTYKVYESEIISGYDKSFFDENVLLVNWLINFNGGAGEGYEKNPSITKDNGKLTLDYTFYMSFIGTDQIAYDVHLIEFKKSDVADVDFSDITVNVTQTYSKAEQLFGPDGIEFSPDPSTIPDKKVNIEMVKVSSKNANSVSSSDNKSANATIATNSKKTNSSATIARPDKVEKVKVKSVTDKQLKVSWKNIKGVKYEIKYSLKKGMKNAKTKKNINKNKVTLKKLKSGKKYYIKVRAYQKIGNKTYTGKWSKKVAKTIK